MKKFFRIVGLIICIGIAIGYFLCALTPYIPPSSFKFSSILALGYPYALAVILLATLASVFVNRKMALVLLVVTLLGYKNLFSTVALHFATSWSILKEPNSLRVLTWNIHGFSPVNHGHDPERWHELWRSTYFKIDEWKPDIICFQEFRKVDIQDKKDHNFRMLDSLGYKHVYFAKDQVYEKPGLVMISGVAIFSKIPIIDSSITNILSGEANENMISADVMLNGKRVRIFTGHLASFGLYDSDTYGNTSMVNQTVHRRMSMLHKIHDREITHEKQVKLIRQKLDASPYPVIYCGDINSTPASYTYHELKGNLQDAYLQKGSGLGKTFYSIVPSLRIDVCLVDSRLKVKQSTVEDVLISDHFPVISDIQ